VSPTDLRSECHDERDRGGTVQIDFMHDANQLVTTAELAAQAESLGFDGYVVPELSHDAFLTLTLAATSTSRIRLASGIAVGFARNPMSLAILGADLQLLSKGRFALGLGTQIKPHITRRFSMPGGSPAAQMREMLLAIREIWACWEQGRPLRFRGEYYKHTLMTPMFTPAKHEFGSPALLLAAVGTRMTAVAGELADGMFCHGFTTAEYIRQVTLPALRLGAERAGRDATLLEISGLPMMAVTGSGDDEAAIFGLRKQLAFYASTPAYRPVLDLHGWGELGETLYGMSRRGRWDDMARVLPEDLLETFALIGSPEQIAAGLHERYDGLLDRAQLYAPHPTDPQLLARIATAYRAGGGNA
jgi:probable F420-dependent oxidoreductase